MTRILVPLDGSARAERAIPWADELANALHAEIELIFVIAPSDVPEESAENATYQLVENETAAGRATLELESEQFGLVPPERREVMHGEPGATIAAHAQSINADLIVMSTHGRGELERTLLGSVADEVIREARVPVMVIRDEVQSPPQHLPQRVLVPLDGSKLAEAVLPYVIPLAQTLAWSLVLFWQVDLPPATIPVQGALIPLDFAAGSGRADMVEYLDRVAADLRAKGVTAEPRVWFGTRAQSIVDFASQEHMDLIAMSTHGRKGFGRWLRGSVADYVLAHAAVPVLTLRPADVPLSSAVAARLAIDEPTATSVSVTFTERQARATRLALEHLEWSSSRHDRIVEDVRGALQALDEAASTADADLVYGEEPRPKNVAGG